MRQSRTAASVDVWITAAGLLGLLAWEASALDLTLTRWIASPGGFPWRESFIAQRLLHDGGRLLGWSLLALLVLDTARPFAAGPSRLQRAQMVAIVLASLILVPVLKRFSRTSCPWDLAEFGGQAAHVPHWMPGISDGGPGHCFPSGHAVAAFAFFGVYFLW